MEKNKTPDRIIRDENGRSFIKIKELRQRDMVEFNGHFYSVVKNFLHEHDVFAMKACRHPEAPVSANINLESNGSLLVRLVTRTDLRKHNKI